MTPALARAREIAGARTRGRYWIQAGPSMFVLPGYRLKFWKRPTEPLERINPANDLKFYQVAEHLFDPLLDVAQAVLELGIDHEESCQAQIGRACSCKYQALHRAVERLTKKEVQ